MRYETRVQIIEAWHVGCVNSPPPDWIRVAIVYNIIELTGENSYKINNNDGSTTTVDYGDYIINNNGTLEVMSEKEFDSRYTILS